MYHWKGIKCLVNCAQHKIKEQHNKTVCYKWIIWQLGILSFNIRISWSASTWENRWPNWLLSSPASPCSPSGQPAKRRFNCWVICDQWSYSKVWRSGRAVDNITHYYLDGVLGKHRAVQLYWRKGQLLIQNVRVKICSHKIWNSTIAEAGFSV